MDDGTASQAAATEASETSLDPRSERLRASLLAAVKELGSAGEQVSVSALVRAAGVSRSAFYLHFNDLADFALHLQRLHLDEITQAAIAERGVDAPRAMLDAQRRLAAHFHAHRQLYRSAITLSGHHGVEDGIVATIAAAGRAHIESIGTLPTGLRADLAAAYIANAATGLLIEWVMGRHEADEETMARHLFEMLPPWMYRAETSAA